jgi:CHAT domain-containing protein/Tfp pilus assembly protein PilF
MAVLRGVFFVSLLLSSTISNAQPLLEPDQPVEREIAAGQSHSYEVQLAAGQYLSAVIDQDGIDVVVQLLGPDGTQIAEFDSEIRRYGPERVSQVAEISGSYRLNVQAKQDGPTKGRYEIRVMELRAATATERDLQEARRLRAEGAMLSRAAKYDEALTVIAHALAIREKTLGPEDPLVAEVLDNLANLYRVKGDYARAEAMFQRVLAISEKALGPEHPNIASYLNNLALLYYTTTDYGKAEPLYHRALAIREQVLGPEHSSAAPSLNNLANLYNSKGDYGKAEPLYQRALAINERVLGPEHPSVATSLQNLAIVYKEKGDYVRAEPLFRRSVAILEEALGPEHPDLAQFLNNLAALFIHKGDYVTAEPLHQRALEIREKVLGPDHPIVSQSLNNLAVLYSSKGDYAKAEPLLRRALSIQEKVFGPEHASVASSLHNLAALYNNKGDYDKAEPLNQRALELRERAMGPDHPDIAPALNNLGTLYSNKGDFAKAEPLLQRALTIRERALGPEHPDVAVSLQNLADLYNIQRDYPKAEPLYQRALAIREKALGPEHPSVASSLTETARLYEAKGDLSQALTLQSRAGAIRERNIALNIAIGSERQKLAYLSSLVSESDQTISLHVHAAPQNSEARSLAITTILRRKGRALDAMADSVGALRGRATPQGQALFDQLKDVRAQLARLVLGGPQRMTPVQYQDRIKNLEAEIEKIETEISRQSDEFRAQAQPVTISVIQSAVPADAALIELYVYRPFNASYTKLDEQFGKPRYVAYVLQSQGPIQWVDLGEAETIDRATETWRAALRDPNRADARRLGRALDERLMRPVRALLGKTRSLLLSPDAALNLIPFGALVDERDRYLIESYSFTYLTSGRDLLRLQVRTPSRQEPFVVANPLFDLGKNNASRPAYPDGESRRSFDFSKASFDPLPSTGIEGRALAAILPGARLLTGADATEAAIKHLRGPSILHIATHGFFLADQEAEDPLLRSGLVLAGANHRQSGAAEDGILTASEVAALDLWGTRLVVLSACDTGLGEVKNGQGVYGLRRALVLAGAQSQVMSLWEVADRPTRELMVNYYKGLQLGQGRSEALRNVQLRMLRSRDRRHPYYWAAFINSGEWANLEGKR